MAQPPRAVKIGSIIWAILIGLGVIVFAGAVILPSTKRSHLDFRLLEETRERQRLEGATTVPAVVEPTTQQ